MGYLGESIQQWLDIDSHLLLYIFLPALLFGDALGLNCKCCQNGEDGGRWGSGLAVIL